MTDTFGTRWSQKSTNGFDYMRLTLSILVVVVHSFQVSYGYAVYGGPRFETLWVPVSAIVPAFFALGGFLVASSLDNCRTLEGFLALRALRVLPALIAAVLISALVLGPLLTVLPLREYFGDKEFSRYFLNIIGKINFPLPGVFEANPDPYGVNKSLWTIPVEVKCYILFSLFIMLGLFTRRRLFLLATLVLTFGMPIFDLIDGRFDRELDFVSARLLVTVFMAGVTLYLYRDRIPRDTTHLFFAMIAAVLCLAQPELQYFCGFPVAYVTVWFGLSNPRRTVPVSSGDYSYGIYVFSFPIQQVVASNLWAQEWWINVLISLPISILAGILSWHFVEAPVLRRKRVVVAWIERGFSGPRRWLLAKGSDASGGFN